MAALTIGDPAATLRVDPHHEAGHVVLEVETIGSDGGLDVGDQDNVGVGERISLLLSLTTADLRALGAWALREADAKEREDRRTARANWPGARS